MTSRMQNPDILLPGDEGKRSQETRDADEPESKRGAGRVIITQGGVFMAVSKWYLVKDKIALVEKWSRDGLIEKQIAKNLGISKTTLNLYKTEHPDFFDALKRGKEVCISEVENALYKRARGYDYEEVKVYTRKTDDGTTEYTEKTRKHQAPDVGACAIILKNRDKDHWVNDPHKVENDKRIVELRIEAEKLKVW